MIFEIANEANERQDTMYEKIGQGENDRNSNDVLTGKYYLSISEVGDNGNTGTHTVKWEYDGKQKAASTLFNIHPDLVQFLYKEIESKFQKVCTRV